MTLACYRRLTIAFTILLLSGCSQEPSWFDVRSDQFIETNYRNTDALIAQTSQSLSSKQALIMTTVVSIDKLERSSTLGRLISEQVSGRLTQRGYTMSEIKLRSNLYINKDQGELMLTREIKELATNHDAQAVVVGTYALSQQLVFVNLKIIQPSSNTIMASVDYALPLDGNMRALLGRK